MLLVVVAIAIVVLTLDVYRGRSHGFRASLFILSIGVLSAHVTQPLMARAKRLGIQK
jgi:hypothetical protein